MKPLPSIWLPGHDRRPPVKFCCADIKLDKQAQGHFLTPINSMNSQDPDHFGVATFMLHLKKNQKKLNIFFFFFKDFE